MSHGRLKASTNRVRTSTALQGNNMWQNTIGLDSQAGSNTAVEASLNAPQVASGRAARRAAAADAVLRSAEGGDEAAEPEGGGSPDLSRPLHFLSEGARARLAQALDKGGFDSAVNSYEGLLTLARSQGAVGGQNRGACKRCGQLGHLTKQCRNQLAPDIPKPAPVPDLEAAAALLAAANGRSLSESSSDDDLDISSISSSSEEERRKKRHHRKRKHSEPAATSKPGKKHKKDRHKHSKKHKRRRRDAS